MATWNKLEQGAVACETDAGDARVIPIAGGKLYRAEIDFRGGGDTRHTFTHQDEAQRWAEEQLVVAPVGEDTGPACKTCHGERVITADVGGPESGPRMGEIPCPTCNGDAYADKAHLVGDVDGPDVGLALHDLAIGDRAQVDEDEVQDALADLFGDLPQQIARVMTYADHGALTRNRGLVVTLANGAEIHLTIAGVR